MIFATMCRHGHISEASCAFEKEIVSEVLEEHPEMENDEGRLKTDVRFLGIYKLLRAKPIGGMNSYWLDLANPALNSTDFHITVDSERVAVEYLRSEGYGIDYWHEGKRSNEPYDIIATKNGKRYYLDAKSRKGDGNFLENLSRADCDFAGFAIVSPDGKVFLVLNEKRPKSDSGSPSNQ